MWCCALDKGYARTKPSINTAGPSKGHSPVAFSAVRSGVFLDRAACTLGHCLMLITFCKKIKVYVCEVWYPEKDFSQIRQAAQADVCWQRHRLFSRSGGCLKYSRAFTRRTCKNTSVLWNGLDGVADERWAERWASLHTVLMQLCHASAPQLSVITGVCSEALEPWKHLLQSLALFGFR